MIEMASLMAMFCFEFMFSVQPYPNQIKKQDFFFRFFLGKRPTTQGMVLGIWRHAEIRVKEKAERLLGRRWISMPCKKETP